jgi:PAS domain S-box-containing protein
MKSNNPQADSAAPSPISGQPLRQRAEATITHTGVVHSNSVYDAVLFDAEVEGLPQKFKNALNELRTYKKEIEVQNEELRRTQAELVAACEQYFDLYNQAPVGYITIDQRGTIQKANLTAAMLLGVSGDEIIHENLSRYISNDDQDTYTTHRNTTIVTGEPQVVELRMMKKSGKQFWARMESAVKECAGEKTHRIVISNITECKESEALQQKQNQQIQQAQKLQSLGVLAGGIAHDFNNLMGGIFGYIDLALMETKDGVITEYLHAAMSTMHRARTLTDKLLTFARGGAPNKKTTPLAPFIQETVHFAVSGSNVACEMDIEENLWSCTIDKGQISQAISNIIINAQQAMPDGGTITVSAGNISFETNNNLILAKGNYVKISIRDHGRGIPEEIMPHIFDPFYTTKTKGHGLGLTTSHSIIKRHGGYIDVESELGQGSMFTLFLPATIEADSVSAPAITEHKGSGIMVIMDDEECIRETTKIMLDAMGYTVVSTKNGRETLDVLMAETRANHRVRAMILDLTVAGGMGGVAAITEIRKTNTTLPVFVASGYSDDPVMTKPCEYGFTASISKPFRRVELAELLEKYVKKG